jgi:AcrR family transcriptional regulator
MGLKERREREREERKRQILDAARSLLFEEGLQATSINKIAKSAELGVGTIYFYFTSKEEIFAALQEEGIELLHDKIKKKLERVKHPEDRLKTIARVYVDFSRENRDYFDIINYFLSSPGVLFSENLKGQIDQRGNRVISLLVSVVEAGISSRDFREVDARKFAMMFWAALHGLILFKKLKTTMLRGEDYHTLVSYSVDYLVNSLKKD